MVQHTYYARRQCDELKSVKVKQFRTMRMDYQWAELCMTSRSSPCPQRVTDTDLRLLHPLPPGFSSTMVTCVALVEGPLTDYATPSSTHSRCDTALVLRAPGLH